MEDSPSEDIESLSAEIPEAARFGMSSVSCQTCPTSQSSSTSAQSSPGQSVNQASPLSQQPFSTQTPPPSPTVMTISSSSFTRPPILRELSHSITPTSSTLKKLQCQNPLLNAQLSAVQDPSIFEELISGRNSRRELISNARERWKLKEVWANRGLPVDDESLSAAASKDAFHLRDLHASLPSPKAVPSVVMLRKALEGCKATSSGRTTYEPEVIDLEPDEKPTSCQGSKTCKNESFQKSHATPFRCDSLAKSARRSLLASRLPLSASKPLFRDSLIEAARRMLLAEISPASNTVPSACYSVKESGVKESLPRHLPSRPLGCRVQPDYEQKEANEGGMVLDRTAPIWNAFEVHEDGRMERMSQNRASVCHKEATEDGRNMRFEKTSQILAGWGEEAASEDKRNANIEKAERNLTYEDQETISPEFAEMSIDDQQRAFVGSNCRGGGLLSPTESGPQLPNINVGSCGNPLEQARALLSIDFRVPFNSPDKTKGNKDSLCELMTENCRISLKSSRSQNKLNIQNSHRDISVSGEDCESNSQRMFRHRRMSPAHRILVATLMDRINSERHSRYSESVGEKSPKLVLKHFKESPKNIRRVNCRRELGNDKVVPD